MDFCGIGSMLVGWLCFTSHRQRGHLETTTPFTVSCEGHEALFLHRSHRESNPGPSRGSQLHYRCATPAPASVECDILLYLTIWHTFLLGLDYLSLAKVKAYSVWTRQGQIDGVGIPNTYIAKYKQIY